MNVYICVFNLKIHKDVTYWCLSQEVEFCWSARDKLALGATLHRGSYLRKQFLYLYINCLFYNTWSLHDLHIFIVNILLWEWDIWVLLQVCLDPRDRLVYLKPTPKGIQWSVKICCHHNTNIPNTSESSAILYKKQPCVCNAKCCKSFALILNSYIINHCSVGG